MPPQLCETDERNRIDSRMVFMTSEEGRKLPLSWHKVDAVRLQNLDYKGYDEMPPSNDRNFAMKAGFESELIQLVSRSHVFVESMTVHGRDTIAAQGRNQDSLVERTKSKAIRLHPWLEETKRDEDNVELSGWCSDVDDVVEPTAGHLVHASDDRSPYESTHTADTSLLRKQDGWVLELSSQCSFHTIGDNVSQPSESTSVDSPNGTVLVSSRVMLLKSQKRFAEVNFNREKIYSCNGTSTPASKSNEPRNMEIEVDSLVNSTEDTTTSHCEPASIVLTEASPFRLSPLAKFLKSRRRRQPIISPEQLTIDLNANCTEQKLNQNHDVTNSCIVKHERNQSKKSAEIPADLPRMITVCSHPLLRVPADDPLDPDDRRGRVSSIPFIVCERISL